MKHIFINPAGQRDNIGDSALRRPYLDALRKSGRLHVYVGDDLDYATNLGIQANDIVYSSRGKWLVHSFKAAFRRELVFAVNAGEFVGTAREKQKSLWQLLLARISRMSSGVVVIAGASVRPDTNVKSTVLPRLARIAKIVTWRDSHTRDLIERGTVQPDWAFSIIAGNDVPAHNRTHIGLLVRGDRPPITAEFLQGLHDIADSEGLEICVAVQVRRDRDRARKISADLGIKLFDWLPKDNHERQEIALRKFYQSCKYVFSDRIHALIISATEGAIPVAIANPAPDKVRRTFAHIGSVPIISNADPSWASASFDTWDFFAVLRASEALSVVSDDIAEVVHG